MTVEERMSTWNWDRLTALFMTIMAVLNLWQREEYVQRMTASGILSWNELEKLYAEQTFARLGYGMMAALFLIRFLTWRVPKPQSRLVDGSVWLTSGIVWAVGAALLRFELLETWTVVLWWAILLAAVGAGTYSLWKYRKFWKNNT